MRLLIDMQGAQSPGSRHRGIGRYTLAITHAIIRNTDPRNVTLLVNGLYPESIDFIREEFGSVLRRDQIISWYPLPGIAVAHGNDPTRRELSKLIYRKIVEEINPDFLLITSLFEGVDDDMIVEVQSLSQKVSVSIIAYDFIPLILKRQYLANLVIREWYEANVRNYNFSRIVLCISDATKNDASSLLGIEQTRCANISAASNKQFRDKRQEDLVEGKRLAVEIGIDKPFILSICGFEYRKNIEGMMGAYCQLPGSLRSRKKLVIVAPIRLQDEDEIKRLENKYSLRSGEVVFTGHISDETLVDLMNMCDVFVFPSRYEGFGLPPLEAMQCGAPVLASNASSLPEVVGRSDCLFDPDQPTMIAHRIVAVLTNDAYRSELAAYGKERAKDFSWDRSARLALEAMSSSLFIREQRNIPTKLKRKTVAASRQGTTRNKCIEVASSLPPEVWPVASASIAFSTFDSERLPHLFVDLSQFVTVDSKTGIQRVVRNIFESLLKGPPSGYVVEPVYASNDHRYRSAKWFLGDRLGEGEVIEDDWVEYRPGDILLGLDLFAHASDLNKAEVVEMRRAGVGVFFIVYDLLCVRRPEFFRDGLQTVFTNWLGMVREGNGAVCISKAVEEDLKDWLAEQESQPLHSFYTASFPLGADIDHEVDAAEAASMPAEVETLLPGRTVLMVGTVEPRKGYKQALEAFEQLWDAGEAINLVVVGKQGWKMEALEERMLDHPQRGQRFVRLSSVDDAQLRTCYEQADVLLVASEGEGYGLPVIEGARAGLPLIVRDLPVFREVAGEGAFYFDAAEPSELAAVIKEWCVLDDEGKAPSPAAITTCTWDESADALLEAIGLPRRDQKAEGTSRLSRQASKGSEARRA